MTRPVHSVRQTKRSPLRIFAWPAAIFVASLAGLVLGLIGTGWCDALAWFLLGAGPLAVGLSFLSKFRIKEFR